MPVEFVILKMKPIKMEVKAINRTKMAVMKTRTETQQQRKSINNKQHNKNSRPTTTTTKKELNDMILPFAISE